MRAAPDVVNKDRQRKFKVRRGYAFGAWPQGMQRRIGTEKLKLKRLSRAAGGIAWHRIEQREQQQPGEKAADMRLPGDALLG